VDEFGRWRANRTNTTWARHRRKPSFAAPPHRPGPEGRAAADPAGHRRAHWRIAEKKSRNFGAVGDFQGHSSQGRGLSGGKEPEGAPVSINLDNACGWMAVGPGVRRTGSSRPTCD